MEGLTIDSIVNYGAIGVIAVFLAKVVQKLYADMKETNEKARKESAEREKTLMNFIAEIVKTQEDIKDTLKDMLEALDDINKRLCVVEKEK